MGWRERTAGAVAFVGGGARRLTLQECGEEVAVIGGGGAGRGSREGGEEELGGLHLGDISTDFGVLKNERMGVIRNYSVFGSML